MESRVPKIRFKNLTIDWDLRNFNTVVKRVSDIKYSSASLPAIEFEDIITDLGILNKDVTKKTTYKQGIAFHSADLVYGKLRPYLKNWILPEFNGVAVGDFWVLRAEKDIPLFIYYLLQTDEFQKIANLSTGTKMPRADWNLVSNSVFAFTNVKEQSLIGSFFHLIDSSIIQNQQKLEKLKTFKKSMLQKMFPQAGSDVPEIRFEGFSGAWKTEVFHNIFMFLQNNTLSRVQLGPMLSKGAKNVHYGDVLIKFGDVLNVGKELLPTISDSEILVRYKNSYLQNGDIVMADTAEDETAGKSTEICGITHQLVLAGLHTIPYRPLIQFSIGYLGYYLNSDTYHDQLLPLMQGTKVISVSRSTISDTFIRFPQSAEEQTKISSFFFSLDSLISQQSYRINKLRTLKKSLLERMFC